jgi:hypothetical protein
VLTAHVRTALALPGNDGWLYFDEQTQKIYLLQKGDAPPGRPLDESQTTLPLKYIFGAGAKAPVSMRWKKPDGVLSHSFHVELMLTPPLVARLACGDISENLPDDVFVGYKDSAHGRAPVRLVSDDGRQYQLIFNPSAKHPVYLLTDANPTGMIYKAEPSKAINLGSEAEFVIGTTHYRLRSTETGANAESLNPQPS